MLDGRFDQAFAQLFSGQADTDPADRQNDAALLDSGRVRLLVLIWTVAVAALAVLALP